MDKFPLFFEEKSTGELIVEDAGLYTWFEACCPLPGKAIWCAWAVGERGELRLGVLEPAGERAVIRRRFSKRMTESLGELLRGEVRPAARTEAGEWQEVSQPETLFRTAFLREQLRGIQGVLTREQEDCRWVALPWDSRRPFLLTGLFCFARMARIQGREYAVFAFDRGEMPVFR